ncbi:MAG: bifunctional folylpolyglutamate synthase/dihydrofolate synthase [Bacteroidetes bacterium]|nr:bifunctional folylpolyglutamate synthase/dihydrofolate synthase [Bacteroidota bacterium]
MTYKETLNYLYSLLPMFHRIGPAAYKNNLDNTIALDKLLGHPHEKFKTIHIAGTNGKGSVSNMLAATLQTAGYKTGLFTSPHLKDFRERIRVNGKKISREYVVHFVAKYQHQFDKIQPSFFEWTTALAFDYFRHKKVDIAVIETGLGGRLDSTNIIQPVLSVITNIGWDHTQLLGNTLRKIAIEKAGIIKPQTPIIIGEYNPETGKVFSSFAAAKKSEIIFADKKYRCRKIASKEMMKVEVSTKGNGYKKTFELSLTGNYQLHNCATVIAAIEKLNLLGIKISDSHVRKALKKVQIITGFSGRWQMLSKKPLIIADTAHNIDGIKYVIRQIRSLKFLHLHIVLGMVSDKDIEAILGQFPKKATYYFCNAKIPRAMPAKDLKNKAVGYNLQGEEFASVRKALNAAKKNASNKDMIFIGGSTFTVAEII